MKPEDLTLFFDMDGLLFDTERTAIAIIMQKSFELGYHLPWRAFMQASGRKYEDCLRITREEAGEDYPYAEIWRQTAEEMRAMAREGAMPLKPGAVELLHQTSIKGEGSCRCWLVTSSPDETASALLQGAGIENLFEGKVTGERVSKGKPHPEIYLTALKRADARAENSLAFEDSPSGVESALAAGIPTIIIPDMQPLSEGLKERAKAVYPSLLSLIREGG